MAFIHVQGKRIFQIYELKDSWRCALLWLAGPYVAVTIRIDEIVEYAHGKDKR